MFIINIQYSCNCGVNVHQHIQRHADLIRQLELLLKVFDDSLLLQRAALDPRSQRQGMKLLLNGLPELCMQPGNREGLKYKVTFICI